MFWKALNTSLIRGCRLRALDYMSRVLGSGPSTVINLLCDLEEVFFPLWVSISVFLKNTSASY